MVMFLTEVKNNNCNNNYYSGYSELSVGSEWVRKEGGKWSGEGRVQEWKNE
jgi:hypothetical protein